MSRSRNTWLDLDWVLVLIYALLVFIGVIAIYSSEFREGEAFAFSMKHSYVKQIVYLGIAFLLAFIIMFFDGSFFHNFSYYIWGITILLLVAVLFLGVEIKGAKSWFRLGPFSLQPSEFAKFGTCLALAKYLSGLNTSFSNIKTYVWALSIVALPGALIVLQGDAGSAIVYGSLIFVMYREGFSQSIFWTGLLAILLFILALVFNVMYLIAALGALSLVIMIILKGVKSPETRIYAIIAIIVTTLCFGVIQFAPEKQNLIMIVGFLVLGISSIALLLFNQKLVYLIVGLTLIGSTYILGVDFAFNNFLQPHQQNRIKLVLGMIEDTKDIGYNVHQSKIAIGSGGAFGKGYLDGTQTKLGYVPELSTDFIYCTIGEEFGFLGSSIVIGLFIFLILRIIAVAERQRSKFSRIYAYGVASIFFLHLVINVGMTVGLFPVIGIPLPFISYGGSSLFGFTILLFILIRLDGDRLLVLR